MKAFGVAFVAALAAAPAAGPADVEILPGCGHLPFREKESDLIALIGTFLRENST